MYSKGVSWFNDARIPFVDGDETTNHNTIPGSFVGSVGYSEKIYHKNTEGRFPPNLLVSDDMLNDGSVSKSGFNPNASIKQYRGGNFGGGKTNDNGIDYGDKGTNSRYYDLDCWWNNLLNKID